MAYDLKITLLKGGKIVLIGAILGGLEAISNWLGVPGNIPASAIGITTIGISILEMIRNYIKNRKA